MVMAIAVTLLFRRMRQPVISGCLITGVLIGTEDRVFLGTPSARVRDEFWKRAIKKSRGSTAVLQIWTDQNPQGFSYRQYGDSERTFINFEEFTLVKIDRSLNSDKNNDTIDS
jgi:CRISPR-associated protein Cas2